MDTPKMYEIPGYTEAQKWVAQTLDVIKIAESQKAKILNIQPGKRTTANKAELKNLVKDIRKLYTKLQAQKDLLEKMPQPKFSAKYLKQNIIDACNATLTAYEDAKIKFISEFSKNPEYAIEWLSDDMVKAQEYARLAYSILSLAESKTCRELIEYLDNLAAEKQRAVLSAASRYSYSSSPAANMIEKFKTAALADAIDEWPKFTPFFNARTAKYYIAEGRVCYDDEQPQ